jgi:hypothetical protein
MKEITFPCVAMLGQMSQQESDATGRDVTDSDGSGAKSAFRFITAFTESTRSMKRTAFKRPNTEIVGSNPT